MSETVVAAAQELYAGPREGFIEARAVFVERLKADGDAGSAAEVAKLRKPSVAAWAVDRLAREHAKDVEALIAAGRELAAAQRQVAGGGDPDRMRHAADERKRLVDSLVRAARTALKDANMSAARATLDKVSDTLLAIATDDDAAGRVRRGVLDKELPAPAGFGDERLDAALLASVTALPTRPAPKPPPGPTPAQVRARERAERLAAEAAELEREADRLEREAVAARRKAESARKRADDAAR